METLEPILKKHPFFKDLAYRKHHSFKVVVDVYYDSNGNPLGFSRQRNNGEHEFYAYSEEFSMSYEAFIGYGIPNKYLGLDFYAKEDRTRLLGYSRQTEIEPEARPQFFKYTYYDHSGVPSGQSVTVLEENLREEEKVIFSDAAISFTDAAESRLPESSAASVIFSSPVRIREARIPHLARNTRGDRRSAFGCAA